MWIETNIIVASHQSLLSDRTTIFSFYFHPVEAIKPQLRHLPEGLHGVSGPFLPPFCTIPTRFNPLRYEYMEKVIINHQGT